MILIDYGTSTESYGNWPDPNPFEPEPKFEPVHRSKQRSPRWKREAKRRRRTALAKHHRKVMKLAAAKKSGTKVSYPKRPNP